MAEMELIKRMGRKVGPLEIDIIQHIANNKTIKEASEEMDISQRGVESRLQKLRSHFRVNSTASLVAIFFRNNLIK